MNQRTSINILLALLLIIILIGVGVYLILVKKPAEPAKISVPTPIPVSTPTPIPQSQLYENQYLKIIIPAGWVINQAIETVFVEGVPQKRLNPLAVNITKDNYILYINIKAQQTSSILGGRFSEIAQGAPSVDAVIKVHPSDSCGFSESIPAFAEYSRIDLYINKRENRDWCVTPSSETTVWYFSYITNQNGYYFNYYKEGKPFGFVITMAYNAKDVNKLPVKESAQLNTMLSEMTAIIKTLEIKQK